MKRKYKPTQIKSAVLFSLLALFVGMVIFTIITGDSNTSESTNSTFPWVVFLPVWVSIAAAQREERKEKEKNELKTVDNLMDESFYTNKTLSAFDGEMIDKNELINERGLYRS